MFRGSNLDARAPRELTPRQAEMVELAGLGLTDKEIAARTGLSVGTLRSHWDRIRDRLGVASRGAAIALALGAEARAAEDEARVLALALQDHGLLVWTALPDGFVDYVGEGLAAFAGMPRAALLGVGCRALMPECQLAESADRWARARYEGRGYGTGVTFRNATGELVPHWIRLRPCERRGGETLRWIGTARRIATVEVGHETVWL